MRVIMKHLSIYNVLIATALLSLALLAACSSEEREQTLNQLLVEMDG